MSLPPSSVQPPTQANAATEAVLEWRTASNPIRSIVSRRLRVFFLPMFHSAANAVSEYWNCPAVKYCGLWKPLLSPATTAILASRSPNRMKLLISLPLSSVVVPHSHPIASTVSLKRMERKSFGFLKAYCSLFPAFVLIIPYRFVNGVPDCGCRCPYASCNGRFPCPFTAVPTLRLGFTVDFDKILRWICFSSFRRLWVCPAASASARPPRPWCPMLCASVRRSHGTTGRCRRIP